MIRTETRRDEPLIKVSLDWLGRLPKGDFLNYYFTGNRLSRFGLHLRDFNSCQFVVVSFFFLLFLLRNIASILKSSEKDCTVLIIFKVEAERRACEEEENKASEEYIQRLLAEEEAEEKRQAEKRHREMEEQLKSDEELARRLSLDIVSFKRELWSISITVALFYFEQSKEEAFAMLSSCFVFLPWGMWNLSSPTRNRTHTPSLESKVLTTGPLRKSTKYSIKNLFFISKFSYVGSCSVENENSISPSHFSTLFLLHYIMLFPQRLALLMISFL